MSFNICFNLHRSEKIGKINSKHYCVFKCGWYCRLQEVVLKFGCWFNTELLISPNAKNREVSLGIVKALVSYPDLLT